MNKLTLEKVLHDLAQLNARADTPGISLREELYRQALEISIPVLEAQAQADKYGTCFVVCEHGTQPRLLDQKRFDVRVMRKVDHRSDS